MSCSKIACLLATIFSLSACGTTSSISMSQPSYTSINELTVNDARSEEQKKSHTTEENGLKNIYFGDDNFKPSAKTVLENAISQRFGSALVGKEITLTDFVINVNEPVIRVNSGDVQNAAASVPNGYAAAPLAELLINLIENSRSEKNVYVQISGKIGDKYFSSNSSENFRGRVTESNIRQVLDVSLKDVLDQINTIVATSSK